MTYQEALNYLNNTQVDMKSIESMCETSYLIETCTKALEKQIPKKPIAVINVDSEDTYRCPSCRATLMFRFQKATFASLCHHCVCGQFLDWGDIK